MASSNLVRLLDHCKISPTPPSPPQCLSLLFFDIFWLRFPPNQRIFFYQSPHPTPTLISTVLPKLKHSLALALHHFVPLAGHLTWPEHSDNPYVEYCPGDGVSVTVAESEMDFDALCGDGFREAELFYPLLPELHTTDTNCVPVVALQITLFPNKGFTFSYSIHHAVMDGKSLSMFIHSWASLCRETVLPDDLRPVFDRNVVKSLPHLEGTFLKQLSEEGGHNNKSLQMWDIKSPSGVVFGSFKLEVSDIENLKKLVRSKLEKEQEQKLSLSTFTITSAFIWVCLLRTHKITSGKVRLVINVDLRARLDPVVPSNYFGNCIGPCFVDLSTSDLEQQDNVAIAAKVIAEALMKLDGTKILNGAGNWISELSNVQADTVYSIAGSPRFEHYKTDFGWGRPRKVEMISIDKSGAFHLLDDRNGDGGLEIGVALKRHESEDFASIFTSLLHYH